ncbi:MAG: nucleotide exchange factor GrpE [Methanomassiliicoccaceae archaeon]|nr:nucleotide exchange factor GrpE [Methanomassiliicoccaceae archaeon]
MTVKVAAEKIRQEADEKIAAAEKKVSENLEMAMRIQADFDNYKKRIQRENEEFRKYAYEPLMSDLLVILDDLERALSHASEDITAGVNGIHQNLIKILSSKGLTEINANGKFDPNIHEALCAEPGDEDGNITEVFQKGYRIGDRILRYAKVKVTRKEGEQK